MNIIIKHVFTKINYLQRKKNFSFYLLVFLVHVYSKLARWGLLIVWDIWIIQHVHSSNKKEAYSRLWYLHRGMGGV